MKITYTELSMKWESGCDDSDSEIQVSCPTKESSSWIAVPGKNHFFDWIHSSLPPRPDFVHSLYLFCDGIGLFLFIFLFNGVNRHKPVRVHSRSGTTWNRNSIIPSVGVGNVFFAVFGEAILTLGWVESRKGYECLFFKVGGKSQW